MENYQESIRWMKDAIDCLRRARRCLSERDWRGTVQNAQLAIELSVKAMIAFFEEPDWIHKPDGQLLVIVEERKGQITKRLGQHMIDALMGAAEDVSICAPWHGWSVYGKAREDSTGWMPAVDLCTADVAEDLMKRAERTINTAEKFLQSAQPLIK